MDVSIHVCVAQDFPEPKIRKSAPVERRQHYTTPFAYSCQHRHPSTSK